MNFSRLSLVAGVVTALTLAAEPWPHWGRTASRNMSSPETGIVADFAAGKMDWDTEKIDMATTRNVKWIAKLGSQAYGNTTVADGRVFIGTNNESPRNPQRKGDYGVVMCLDEATGDFLWQLTVAKLGAGKVSDWEYLGICSSPGVDGNRVYVVTNRCEVVCLDVHGLSNGNDGPYREEGAYIAGEGKPPAELHETDADIIWRFDMRDELGVFPHNIASSSVLVVGDRLYVTTSNGQDWSHVNIPSPRAPCLIVLDKHKGTLIAEESAGISTRLFHCNWSSPSFGQVDGRDTVVFGAGDGFCYGFDPEPKVNEDGFGILSELWRFDCNPVEYKTKDGKPAEYPSADGPSEIIATPVLADGLIYVCTGQDPEHGQGVGCLSCIRVSGSGDITATGAAWLYKGLHRSISTPAVADGLVYAGDFTGRLHCLDAKTGAVQWVHDTQSYIWSSPLVVDGKVFIGNEDGVLTVMQAGREKKVLHEIEMPGPIYASPIVANGVLYIATQTHLFAIGK